MNLTWPAQQGIFACGMTQQQDVYKVVWRELPLYIKFQKAADYFVISFKENTE